MGTSNFVNFNPTLANAEADAAYAADATVTGGLANGIASPQMHNKLFHQTSIMAAAIAGAIVDMGGTASDVDVNALKGAIEAAFATISGTQTLTNKTLTSPTINTPALNGSGGALTLPAGPDTLVGRATTDTLTNKTLTSPTVNTPTLTGPYVSDEIISTQVATPAATPAAGTQYLYPKSDGRLYTKLPSGTEATVGEIESHAIGTFAANGSTITIPSATKLLMVTCNGLDRTAVSTLTNATTVTLSETRYTGDAWVVYYVAS